MKIRIDPYDGLFVIGMAALEVGLWLRSPALAFIVGGVLLMVLAVVIPAIAGKAPGKPGPQAKE
jgi:hypothetical protein